MYENYENYVVSIETCMVSSTVSNNGPDQKRDPQQILTDECNISLHTYDTVLYLLNSLHQDD